MADAQQLENISDLTPYKRWEAEIKNAEKEVNTFWNRGDYATKKYLDERDAIFEDNRYFNIYYANTNILESSLYSQIPKPCVERQNKDYLDQVARVGALILQRALEQDLNDPTDRFDSVMRQAVQDRLVPGLGVAWLRLETDTEDIPESEGGTVTNNSLSTQPDAGGGSNGFTVLPAEGEAEPGAPAPVEAVIPLKRITLQRVVVDYVYWKDFLVSPCRTWEERRWVARKVYMSREALVARFGEKGKLCNLNFNARQTAADNKTAADATPKNIIMEKAVVYEIWDREERKVHWFCEGYPSALLDSKDDFLKLQSFEPVPTPMLANITTSNVTPRPDYYMIKDQYEELDTVNARISLLVSACKVVGIYNSNEKALQNLMQGKENTMVPVQNWAQFSEKGGVDGNVQWMPLEDVVNALQRLYEAREAIKGQIYELTGIADIVRGASKASETLGAQQIKAQFASVRIKKLQDEVARFASDILRIRAEIMTKHFTTDMLVRKSNITNTDNNEYVPEAIALIKSEEGFNWRVQVEADSMAQADYASEKADRIEFMSAVTGFMAQAMPMAQQMPEMKPALLGLLKWGIAGFKKGADIEGMIDKQLALMEGKPPAPPPPDPAMIKAQADQQRMQQQMQIDQQKSQQEMAMKQKEMEFKEREAALEMKMKEMDLQFKERELQLKAQEQQVNLQATMQKNQVDMETHQQQAALKVQDSMIQSDLAQRQGEQQLELSERQGEQQLEQTKAAGDQKLEQGKAEGKQKLTLAKQAQKDKSKGDKK